MAGRYTGSYLDKLNDWRVAAIQADIGRASLVKRIPTTTISRFDHASHDTGTSSHAGFVSGSWIIRSASTSDDDTMGCCRDVERSQAKVPPSAFHGGAVELAQGLVPCTGALLTLDNSENAQQPIKR